MENHLYSRYFILNISKIICEDLQTDSLANYLVSRIISVETILELIALFPLILVESPRSEMFF